MKSIDERIVDMQFNNKQFEDGIQTSLKSLDDLNKGLDKTGKGPSLEGLQSGVEEIANRFSTLGIIGVTALQNITNAAITAGSQMIKSLTIAPITEGYEDYERKITSVQTIMNATGKDINTVSGYFDQLDTYADLTIYKLSDMTSAFAKFTNAGVDMDKSVPAIKGIANMVALAGQDANAASIAMYNLSQSIAGGYLTTLDYKSLNLANVATKEWKTQMIEGAIAAGTLKRSTKGLYDITGAGSAYTDQQLFTEALKDGWATTNVLLDVLGDYGDTNTEIGKKAQSAAQDVKSFSMMMDTLKASVGTSWTESFELIIGDLEESKELFTGVTAVISGFLDASANARNDILQTWKDLGGRTALLDSIKNAFDGMVSVITPIREAFQEIFPPLTGEKLFAFTEGLKAFTENLKIGDETADNLKNTFKGLFAAVDILGQVIGFLFDKFTDLVGLFIPGTGGLLAFTGSIGEFIVGLNDAIRASDIFNKAFDTIKNSITEIVSAIDQDVKGMLATPAFQTLQDIVLQAGIKIKEAFDVIKEAFDNFGGVDLSGAKRFVDEAVNNFRPFTALGVALSSGFEIIQTVLARVAPIFSKLASIVGTAFNSLSEAVSGAFRDGGFQGVLDVINSGMFAAILFGIKKFMDSLTDISKNAGGFVDGITGILDGVKGSLEAYQNTLKANVLLTIASAIGILAASLVVLSMLDPAKLGVALVAITTLFIELSGAMIVLQKAMGTGSMVKVAGQMVIMSAAILILSSALKSLAELDWGGLTKGIIGVGALAAILVKSAETLSAGAPKMIKGGLGLIAFSTAILILAQSVKQLGDLDVTALAKGLLGVGVLMAEVAGFTKLVNPEKLISTGLAMIAMGAAIKIFASAVGDFGQLNVAELVKGLGAMGVILLEIAGFSQIINPSKLLSTGVSLIAMAAAMVIFAKAIAQMGALSLEEIGRGLLAMAGSLTIVVAALNLMPEGIGAKAASLLILSGALVVLSQAMQSLGGMSWEEIAKSLITLAGSLLIITVAMNAMTGGLAGAAAMTVMAAALLMLAPALMMLGGMQISEIGLALLALVGVFAVVGGAALILAPLTPIILGLAAAIVLLGVGVLGIGAGLLAFSAGLTALALAGSAGAAALVVVVTSLLSLIPMALRQLGAGVVAFAQVITSGMPAIMAAVKAIATGLIQVIVEITPSVVAALLTFLVTLLNQLATAVPQMVDAGMRLFIGILEGIAKNIQDVVVVALKIIEEFLLGIAEGIPGVVAAGVSIIVAFIRAIGEETPRIVDAGFKMVIDFVNGLAKAIRENTQPLIDAFGNLADAMIDGLVNGLTSGVRGVADAAVNLGKSALNGVKNFLGIHSPSTVFKEEIGKNMALGTAQGIDENASKAAKAAKKMADDAYNAAKLWIQNYQNDTEYLVSEELKMWEELGTKYEGLSKERVEIDKNANALRKKMADAQKAADKAVFENSKKWIEQKKGMEELSLLEEIAAWERVQARYLEGTDERKEADQQLFDAKKRLFEEQERLTDLMEAAEEKYQAAVDARAQAIVGTYGIFDELKKKEEVSGKTLTDNLKAQVESMRSWSDNLATLSKKGIDEGLLAELQKMGPEANTEITALSNMTDRELAKYQDLWREKNALARSQAITELQGLRVDTSKEIAGIKSELDKLNIAAPTAEEDKDTKTFEDSGKASIDAVITGYNAKTPEALAAIDAINTKVNTQIATWKPKYTEAGSNLINAIILGFKNKEPEVVSTCKTIISKALGEFRGAIQEWFFTGQQSVAGFIEGMRDKIHDAARMAAEIARAAYNAAKNELDIRSPSRKFMELGQFTAIGFANGLSEYAYLSENAITEMSKGIIDTFNEAISTITDLFSEDLDMAPVIRPVIDLDAVDSGIKEINNRKFNLSGMVDSVSGVARSMSRTPKEPGVQGGVGSGEKAISFVQNNYSPKALSRLEIYRNTRNQFSAMKEVLN